MQIKDGVISMSEYDYKESQKGAIYLGGFIGFIGGFSVCYLLFTL